MEAPVVNTGFYDPWPMFQHDLNKTGYSLSLTPNTNNTLWVKMVEAEESWTQSPAVADGMVFMGFEESEENATIFCALHAETGDWIWNSTLDRHFKLIGTPSVAYGKVYFGGLQLPGNGKIYALDEYSGLLVWEYWLEQGIRTASPIVADERVFLGLEDGKVMALNATNGRQIWNYTCGARIASSPAFSSGILYLGSDEGKIYALNATNGELFWASYVGGEIFSSPALWRGSIYVGSTNGNLTALDPKNGSVIWSSNLGPSISSSMAVAYGEVFVGSWDKNVYALNATTGGLIWNFETGDAVYSSVAVGDGKIFIGSGDGRLYAISANNGTLIWSYETGYLGYSSPVIAYEKVYMVIPGMRDDEWKLICFGSPSNRFFYEITFNPIFYDNMGEPLSPAPSWSIEFPNRTSRIGYNLQTYFLPLGIYSIVNVTWKEELTHNKTSIFLDSNVSWSPKINCVLPTRISLSLGRNVSYAGGEVEINSELSCNEKGVRGAPVLISYSVDSGENWININMSKTDFNGVFSVLWVPPDYGNYLIKAVWAGNFTFPASKDIVILNVLVDETPPTLLVISPLFGQIERSPRITVSWNSSDAGSGIAYYEVKMDDNPSILVEVNVSPQSYTFDGLLDGSHIVEVKAVDNAGNDKEVQVLFIVDTSFMGGPGWTDDVAIFSIVAFVIVISIVLMLKRRP